MKIDQMNNNIIKNVLFKFLFLYFQRIYTLRFFNKAEDKYETQTNCVVSKFLFGYVYKITDGIFFFDSTKNFYRNSILFSFKLNHLRIQYIIKVQMVRNVNKTFK